MARAGVNSSQARSSIWDLMQRRIAVFISAAPINGFAVEQVLQYSHRKRAGHEMTSFARCRSVHRCSTISRALRPHRRGLLWRRVTRIACGHPIDGEEISRQFSSRTTRRATDGALASRFLVSGYDTSHIGRVVVLRVVVLRASVLCACARSDWGRRCGKRCHCSQGGR